MGKGNKIRLHERSLENDIKYRGPFSYRHLRMFGWLFLVLAQIATILNVAAKINPELDFGLITQVISTLSSLTVPLFLTANFSVILTSQKNYKPLLIKYAALMLGTTLLFFYVYEHIIGGVFRAYLGSDDLIFEQTASLMIPNGFIAFNIFLDLFLCSLFMFLLNCRPKKHFQGKKVVWLRLLALVPVLYELGCIVLKGYAAMGSGGFSLPVWAYPFLTTKPPVTFLVFIILAFYVKKRERVFLKNEKTHEDFTAHMKTNYNSLRFSLYTSKIFLIAGLLDVILLFALPFVIGADPGHLEESYDPLFKAVQSSGFGDSIMLIPMIPFMLLFSYTRTHKNRLIDAVIPLGGIALIIAVYVEGSYQVLTMLSGYLSPTLREVLRGLLFSGMP